MLNKENFYLFSRDDRSVGDQRKMDPGIGHQISLELVKVNVEGSIESKRSGDRRDDLRDEAVKVSVRGPLDVQVPPTDVVDGLVVHHEGAVGVLQGSVGTESRVVGLYHGSGHLGSGVDGEFELGLLPIVHRQTLHQERSETRASSPSKGMENEESLKPSAVISELPDPVKDKIYDLLAHCVVAPGVVVGRVLLTADHLLRVEQLAVGSSPDFVHNGGLEVEEHRPGHVLACPSLTEEGREAVVPATSSLVATREIMS